MTVRKKLIEVALPLDTKEARCTGAKTERVKTRPPPPRHIESFLARGDSVHGHARSVGTDRLRFIEVKGRLSGAATITVTKNEILYSLNKPEDFILAIVEFLDGDSHRVHYLRRPFQREPDFGVTSVNYRLEELIDRAEDPR